MPNWCFNRVSVSGDPTEVKAFHDKHLTSDFFNSVIPMPQELRDTPATYGVVNDDNINKYGYNNWYDWSCAKWGCKWDVSPKDIEIVVDDVEDGYISFEFETAWCPPEAVYHTLVSQYPNLAFSWFYDEPGMAIAGYLENQG